jgi:hypothetical protein
MLGLQPSKLTASEQVIDDVRDARRPSLDACQGSLPAVTRLPLIVAVKPAPAWPSWLPSESRPALVLPRRVW